MELPPAHVHSANPTPEPKDWRGERAWRHRDHTEGGMTPCPRKAGRLPHRTTKERDARTTPPSGARDDHVVMKWQQGEHRTGSDHHRTGRELTLPPVGPPRDLSIEEHRGFTGHGW